MRTGTVCWKCGTTLDEPLPLARLAECPACRAELHVCRQCECFDARLAEQCAEERAEPPSEKARANFCDYFRPSASAYTGRDVAAEQAARAQLEALFGAPAKPAAAADDAEQARRELQALFGSRDKT